MRKQSLAITVLFLLLSFTMLFAEGRAIGCEVISNNNYEPGTSTVLSFEINFTGNSYDMTDYFELEFPEGMTPTSGTNIGSESATVSGQKVKWGVISGWTGSGMGTMSGNNSVTLAVDIAASVGGDQNVEFEAIGDDPETCDSVTGIVIVNQVANGPIILVDTEELNFGINNIDSIVSHTITVSNIGIGELVLSAMTFSNASEMDVTTALDGVIAAGASRDFEIEYTPTDFNYDEVSLTISSNGGVDKIVELCGFGIKESTVLESFENQFPPSGWNVVEGSWAQGTSYGYEGSKSAYLNYNNEGRISTPKLAIEADDKIIFAAGNQYVVGENLDVQISSNGSDWTTIQTIIVPKTYEIFQVPLGSFTGSYFVGFYANSNQNTYLDNILIPAIDMAGIIPSVVTAVAPEDGAENRATELELSWNSDVFADGYKLSFGTNAAADNILSATDLGDVTTHLISDLLYETEYFWKVLPFNANGEASNVPVWSFTTEQNSTVTPPYSQDFTSYPPIFWSEAKGMLAVTSDLTGETSNWIADGFLNNSTTGSARLNIWGTSTKEWMITPSIDLSDNSSNYQLNFKVGLTKYSGSDANDFGEDDIFAVVISTDNGATWSSVNVLKEWGTTDPLSNEGEEVTLSLEQYSGLIKIGFYGESTTSNEDVNAYIDDLSILPAVETPIFSATPALYDFNDTINGNETEAVEFSLANTGSGTLRIESVTLSDETNFSITDVNNYPVELTSNAVSFSIKFNPAAAADFSTNIVVVTNAGEQFIPLNGSGYNSVAGDLISNAINVGLDEEGNYTVTSSIDVMHNDYDLAGNDDKEVVYQLDISTSATATISLEGSEFDTKLGVFQSDDSENWIPTEDNHLFYNDNYYPEDRFVWSKLEDLELSAGTYYLLIDSNQGSTGNYTLCIEADVQSIEADVEVTPESFDFQDMVVNETTDFQVFEISNGGETAFTVNSIELADESNFQLLGNYDFPIEVNENSISFQVALNPSIVGNVASSVNVITNSGTVTVPVTGNVLPVSMVWENFEEETFPAAGWSTIDNDGDEHNWHAWSGNYARSGDRFAASNAGSMWGDDYDPDDWMITPKLSVVEGDKFIYYVRPMNPEYAPCKYKVVISTTGNSTSDFTQTLLEESVTPEIWVRKEIDLAAFAGQNVYLAFNHINDDSQDGYSMCIDDVFMPSLAVDASPVAVTAVYPEDDSEYIYGTTVLQWSKSATASGYKLSLGTDNPPTNLLNEVEVDCDTKYLINDLTAETTYFWSVKAVNGNGETASAVFTFATNSFEEYIIPYTMNFNNCNSMPFYPEGWSEFKGILTEESEFSVNTFSGWVTDDFANGDADNNSLCIDLYGDKVNNLTTTSTIDMGSDAAAVYQMRFDMALTAISSDQATEMGSDDLVALVVSTDDGASWKRSNILKTWTAENEISNIGQPEYVEVTGFTGKVRFGFYAESLAGGNSSKIFIDNLVLAPLPDEPIINILPHNAEYELTQIGQLSASKVFRVSNVGIDTLRVQSVALGGDDADQFNLIDANSYPVELTTDQISFNVIFHPATTGNKEAKILVTDGSGVHEVIISGFAYGTNGDTIEDPIIIEMEGAQYTTWGSTEGFSDSYTLPYETVDDDTSDVVYKVSFANDVTAFAGLTEMDWDSKMAVYSADETPGPDNFLYYNDDPEEMRIRKSGDRDQTRGYNSVISNMKLSAGSYYFVIDGSNKTSWFNAYGEYRFDLFAYNFAAPTNLTVANEANNAVLSWDAATVVDGTLTGYVVIRNGYPNSELITATTFTDDSVVAGFDYTYSIIAMYSEPNGYSFPSNGVDFTTGESADILLNEGFESYDDFAITMDDWTLNNADGGTNVGIEGFEFANMAEEYAFIVFNPTQVQPAITHPSLAAKTGSKYAAHFLSEEHANNDWIITPKLNLGTESAINFWAKSFSNSYGYDHIKVGISTTDTEPGSFTFINSESEAVPTSWKQYIYDLSGYDEQEVYVAIQVVETEGFIFMLDDFQVLSNGGSLVDTDDPSAPQLTTKLNGNYPNPFNPTTKISFSLQKESKVELSVFNIKGQKVTTLVNQKMLAGQHNISWNGVDASNKRVSSGVYFYKMEADKYTNVKKMILLK